MALVPILALQGGLVKLVADVNVSNREIVALEIQNGSDRAVTGTLDRPVGDTLVRTVDAGTTGRKVLDRPVPLSVALELIEDWKITLAFAAV